jgi:hypothetical protein
MSKGVGGVLVIVALAAVSRPALPCATAPRPGERVAIQNERAVIVWDARHKMEHFIRDATFDAPSGAEFGFLVPTPTQPELAEAPARVFTDLADAIEHERRTVKKTKVELGTALGELNGCTNFGKKNITKSAPPPVRVLEEKQVAGLDATVLEADDPAALAAWLGAHGFENRPALIEWLAPYVAARWKLTAFRYGGASTSVHGAALRMSFAADRPFYPYREPSDAGAPAGRSLRVYLVSDGKMQGSLGDDGRPWPADVQFAGHRDWVSRHVAPVVPTGTLEGPVWLTAFHDHSERRNPGELFFAAAADTKPVPPPPIVTTDTTIIPVDFIAVGLILLTFTLVVALRARRRQLSGAATPGPPA